MLRVGLTGGIGSGKSTVAKLFAALGIPIIDADIIAKEVISTPPTEEALIKKFGTKILRNDQTIDRKSLQTLIFKDLEARKWLETLLHPLIAASIQAQIQQLSAPYVLVIIPLLVETGAFHLIDRVLVIDTTLSNQLHRAMERDSLSEETVEGIIEAQATREQRLSIADDIITNNSDVENLASQVMTLHQRYLQHGS